MTEGQKRHLAFLEDMYEDQKGQKKVKVRWFHHNQEVNCSVILRNPHPKEVLVTPYTQVISVECVDGPAIVLTHEHYEKVVQNLPEDLLTRVYLCFRQFKNNRVKPFKLSRLRGYFDQPIFSFLDRDDDESGSRGVISYEILRKKLIPENRELCFTADEKVELLCQDSGIRGCWFRCTVLRVARRRIKEWVSTFKTATPDKLGLRHSGRPTRWVLRWTHGGATGGGKEL